MKSSPPDAIALEFNAVTFQFRDTLVLDNLNLQIPEGQFTVIIGPNGSGKTTLLKLCYGVLKPRSGTVWLQGKPLASFTPRQIAQTIAVLPQETSISVPFTVQEVVTLGRHPYHSGWGFEVPEDLEIVANCMTTVGVHHLASRVFTQLSGGEKQRTMIAAVLAQQPSILLLDEPTSALDLKYQIGIYQVLKAAQLQQNLTLVAVTHDVNLATMYCDRIILLKNGRILDDGLPNTVITQARMEQLYEVALTVIPHPIYPAPLVVPR
ncbi:heme ABC transporter ATP-binding protein [candidate division KSB1 bacterium]|nr:heme ABC transporter ATP-binding protein [candidate division KSB1 bacterium]